MEAKSKEVLMKLYLFEVKLEEIETKFLLS